MTNENENENEEDEILKSDQIRVSFDFKIDLFEKCEIDGFEECEILSENHATKTVIVTLNEKWKFTEDESEEVVLAAISQMNNIIQRKK